MYRHVHTMSSACSDPLSLSTASNILASWLPLSITSSPSAVNTHRTQSFFLLIPRRWQGHNGHNGVVSFFLSEEPLGPRGILGLATDGAT